MTEQRISNPPPCDGADMRSVRMRWGIEIPLSDIGERLSGVLYLPHGPISPSPTLFALTPYTTDPNHARARYFAEAGYPFLVVDTLGRGNSSGCFHAFAQEGEVAAGVIDWIARQPFCNGKVAMFSGSYEGYVQWAAAARGHPALRAIAPLISGAPGIDFPMRNNIMFSYAMRWLTSVSGRAGQATIFADQSFWRDQFASHALSGLPFRQLDEHVGNPSNIFQRWLDHPSLDSYWADQRPDAGQYARIDIPVLTVTGSYDTDQPGALHFYREHVAHGSPEAVDRHYLVIGPWDHQGVLTPKVEFGGLQFGEAAQIDSLDLLRQWYDWTLKDGKRPAFLQRKVAYYVMGAERWRYADSLAAITEREERLFLWSSENATSPGKGALRARNHPSAVDGYDYDPSDHHLARIEAALEPPAPMALLRPSFPVDSLVDQTVLQAIEGRALFYDSEPFEHDVEVSGFFRLEAWMAIDQLDTDFLAMVYEVASDGEVILLTTDMLRARYREGLDQTRLIETTAPLRYGFERFTFVSRLIRAGHRLRLILGPLDSIYYQKNRNSGKSVSEETAADSQIVKVTLCKGPDFPSALVVPLASRE